MNQTMLTRAWAAFLNSYNWDWYATLTFKYPVTIRQAFKRFNKWKVGLKHAANNHINYAMAIELSRFRGDTPHLHLFLSGTKNQKPYIWERKWYQLGGFAKIEPYNPTLGANYYLANKIVGEVADIKFSKRLTRSGIKPAATDPSVIVKSKKHQ